MGSLSVHRHGAFAALALFAAVATVQGHFTFEKTDANLTLREHGEPVLVFNHTDVQPPCQGVARSGYVHPLYGPEGDVLTDDFPADHLHHRGVFFGWPAMTVKGQRVDYWHLRGLRPSFEELTVKKGDGAAASFESRNIWRLDDQTEAVLEHLRYRVHPSSKTGRAIDIHATFTNLTDEPVILSGKPQAAYGGLNIRMDGTRPDVQITTAESPITGDANFIDPPSPWADHSSRPETGQPHSGVAIFQHPDNPDYPARNWTLRPYGFLGAAWPGESNYTISPGESLDLRYRLFVHRGTAVEADIAKEFDRYARENG